MRISKKIKFMRYAVLVALSVSMFVFVSALAANAQAQTETNTAAAPAAEIENIHQEIAQLQSQVKYLTTTIAATSSTGRDAWSITATRSSTCSPDRDDSLGD